MRNARGGWVDCREALCQMPWIERDERRQLLVMRCKGEASVRSLALDSCVGVTATPHSCVQHGALGSDLSWSSWPLGATPCHVTHVRAGNARRRARDKTGLREACVELADGMAGMARRVARELVTHRVHTGVLVALRLHAGVLVTGRMQAGVRAAVCRQARGLIAQRLDAGELLALSVNAGMLVAQRLDAGVLLTLGVDACMQ